MYKSRQKHINGVRTMEQVLVRNGTYGKMKINDTVFNLVKGYTVGKKSNFITVDGTAHDGLPDRPVRINLVSKEDMDTKVINETDEQVMERLRERFDILTDMSYAACDGVVRGMVVTGPPGVGKSYGVEQVVREAEVMNKMSGGTGNTGMKFGMEKGAASAIGLFKLLFDYSGRGSVLVLYDCDSVLYDETSLNLLKAAL